jgi:hypothetical protein
MGEEAEIEDLFGELAERFLADPAVTQGTGFGKKKGLRVSNKIFAIFGADDLTVKLPKARVDQLVEDGVGIRFDTGGGRIMKEWVTVPAGHRDDWAPLATEALAFVRPA